LCCGYFTACPIVSVSALSPVNIQEIYRAWCKKNNFESKLEEDVLARKKAATDAEEAKAKLHQKTLDPHLHDKSERVVPYSDSAFRDAALEWLIATNQVRGHSLHFHCVSK
jgi:hypothetical protein